MQDKHELPKTAEGDNTNLENIAKSRLRGRPKETPRLGSSRHLRRKRSWGLSTLNNFGLHNINTYGKFFEALFFPNQI